MTLLSFVVPAYNEEGAIVKVLEDCLQTGIRLTSEFEVVVVNDGSRDQTARLIDQRSAQDPRIKTVHHSTNLGFGPALRSGFSKAQGEWVFFVPGDGQVPADQLFKLWPATDQADYILGWRKDRQDSAWRRFLAGTYNGLISLVARHRFHDIDSSVLFKRPLAFHPSLESTSGFIHAELGLNAIRQGATVREIPIAHLPRRTGKAQGHALKNMARMGVELCRYLARRQG